MNFSNLEYFVKVADRREIHAAAVELYITDQALSKTIKKLEEELACALFERTRPLVLTTEGQVVYQNAQKILKQKNTMMSELQAIGERKTIRLSVLSYGVPSFLNQLLLEFQKKYPETMIELNLRPTLDLHSSEYADLYFNPGYRCEGYHDEVILEDQLCAIVSKELFQSVYGGDAGRVMKEATEQEDINLLKRLPFVQCDPYFWSLLGDDVSVKPETLTKITNVEINVDMCLSGLKATVMPLDEARRMLKERNRLEDVLVFPLKTKRGSFCFSIAYEENKKLTGQEMDLISMCTELVRK